MSQDAIGDRLADYLRPSRDNAAVDKFAIAMKEKMAHSRLKGRSGWEQCTRDDLMAMLREHVEKGDMRDVANIAMMIWHNERRSTP